MRVILILFTLSFLLTRQCRWGEWHVVLTALTKMPLKFSKPTYLSRNSDTDWIIQTTQSKVTSLFYWTKMSLIALLTLHKTLFIQPQQTLNKTHQTAFVSLSPDILTNFFLIKVNPHFTALDVKYFGSAGSSYSFFGSAGVCRVGALESYPAQRVSLFLQGQTIKLAK